MVMIEEESKEGPMIPKSKPVRDQPSTSTAAAEDSRQGGGDSNAVGYNSDGFETASDTELNDEEEAKLEDDRSNEKSSKSEGDVLKVVAEASLKEKEEQKQQPQERNSEHGDEKNDEKALAEANNEKIEGNALFKDGLLEEALSKYETALQLVCNVSSSGEICSVCHANRAACFYKMGKFEETIKECTKALELNPKYIKVLHRRGEAHEKLEHFDEAIADMTKILEVDPSNDQARRNIVRLKPLADEKREKMKEEMIGKLKDMGNSILGQFGMSVDNFKAVKDPNTGSYSVSFQR